MALLGLAVSSTAFAKQVIECDPSNDPHECGCDPALNSEQCVELNTTVSDPDLVTSEDPERLRNAIGLMTEYDVEHDIYVVTADASQLNKIGLVIAHSNHGVWEKQALLDYVYALLGVEQSQSYDSILPPIRMTQRGDTARLMLNSSTNALEFSQYNFGDIVLDAITGYGGELYVKENGETLLWLKPEFDTSSTGDDDTSDFLDPYSCRGTGPTDGSYNWHQASWEAQIGSTLSANQCSRSFVGTQPYDPICDPINDECLPVSVAYRSSQNKVYGLTGGTDGGAVTCNLDPDGQVVCNAKKKRANITLTMEYHQDPNSISTYSATALNAEGLSHKREGGVYNSNSYGPIGTCAEGVAKDGVLEIKMKTANGAEGARAIFTDQQPFPAGYSNIVQLDCVMF